jgi:hypothetical protein
LYAEFKKGKYKYLGWEWGKGCMYIKEWFKSIFPLFLTWLLHKLKFLLPMVEFFPHPHPMLLAKLHL